MAALDFRLRPVAGVAADLKFGPEVRPGQTLDLRAEIHSYDEEAVDFSAWAHVDGVAGRRDRAQRGADAADRRLRQPGSDTRALRAAVRAGRARRAVRGRPRARHRDRRSGPRQERACAAARAARRGRSSPITSRAAPVFPGTLLLDAQIQVSLQAAAGATHWPAGAKLAATLVPEMKLRAFIAPGELVELRADLSAPRERGHNVGQDRRLRKREANRDGRAADRRLGAALMKAKRRVAITGLGLVTPAGNTVADTWRTLLAGRSCIGPSAISMRAGFPTRIAAEVRGFDAVGGGRRPQAAQVRQPVASLCAGGRRASVPGRGHPAVREHPPALGLHGGHRHDGAGVRRSRSPARSQRSRR